MFVFEWDLNRIGLYWNTAYNFLVLVWAFVHSTVPTTDKRALFKLNWLGFLISHKYYNILATVFPPKPHCATVRPRLKRRKKNKAWRLTSVTFVLYFWTTWLHLKTQAVWHHSTHKIVGQSYPNGLQLHVQFWWTLLLYHVGHRRGFVNDGESNSISDAGQVVQKTQAQL